MARSVDARAKQSNNEGIDMRTMARTARSVPSLAEGCSPTGLADGVQYAAGSPGAVLGTGANADTYTPGIEAV